MATTKEVPIALCGKKADNEGVLLCPGCFKKLGDMCRRCGTNAYSNKMAWSCPDCRAKANCGQCHRALQEGEGKPGHLCHECFDENHRICDYHFDPSQAHFTECCKVERIPDAPKFKAPIERRKAEDDLDDLPFDWTYKPKIEMLAIGNKVVAVESKSESVRDKKIPFAARGDAVQRLQSFRDAAQEKNMNSSDLRAVAAEIRQATPFKGWRIQGANMEGMDLHGLAFVDCRMQRSNFNGANLQGADLSGSLLLESVFKGACLKGAKLSSCTIGRADLTGADLSGADLSGCDFRVAKMQGAKLDGARVYMAVFNDQDADRVMEEVDVHTKEDKLVEEEEVTFRKQVAGLEPNAEADKLYVALANRRASVARERTARAQASLYGKPVPPMPTPVKQVLPGNFKTMALGTVSKKVQQIVIVPGETCPNGHKLEMHEHGSFGCNNCNKDFRNEDEYECRRCKYRLCVSCQQRLLRKTKGKTPGEPVCSKNHPLVLVPCSSGFTCDSCKVYYRSGAQACRCVADKEKDEVEVHYHEYWCMECVESFFEKPAPGPKYPPKQPGPPRCSRGHDLEYEQAQRDWTCDGPCQQEYSWREGNFRCSQCGETWCKTCIDHCFGPAPSSTPTGRGASAVAVAEAPKATAPVRAKQPGPARCDKGHRLGPLDQARSGWTCDGPCKKQYCGGLYYHPCSGCSDTWCKDCVSQCFEGGSASAVAPATQQQQATKAKKSGPPCCSDGHALRPLEQSRFCFNCRGPCSTAFSSGADSHKCTVCNDYWCAKCVAATFQEAPAAIAAPVKVKEPGAPHCSDGHPLKHLEPARFGFVCRGPCKKTFNSDVPSHR